MKMVRHLVVITLLGSLVACSSAYYSGLEKVGIPKRDVMVHRVEKARDTQEETKAQFKSALAQFTAVTNFKGGDLEKVYTKLNDEYEASVKQAALVRKRIDDIDSVSNALFTEWAAEIEQYQSVTLKRSSQQKLTATKQHYQQLMAAMNKAEAKISPVLSIFKDQVLYLKHNLNARAIASLKNELGSVQSDVGSLVAAMESSINEANAFIKTVEK
ncbi:MAG: DUF2959 domain-containing protein [Methylococcaceae bacterium]